MISGTQLQQLRNDGYDDAADEIERLRSDCDKLYDAIRNLDITGGCVIAAKKLLPENEA